MPEKPKCPHCDSTQVYYRRILEEFVCRRCGHTWKKAAIEEKVAREEREKQAK